LGKDGFISVDLTGRFAAGVSRVVDALSLIRLTKNVATPRSSTLAIGIPQNQGEVLREG
jgi:hypothetical protein